MTPEDFDSFISTLMAETELRARIAQLQEYRRFGIQTFKQADEYEQEKKQRLQTMLTRSPFAATSDRLSAKQMVQMNSSQTPTAASRKQSLAVGQSDADTSGSAYDRLNLLTVNEQAFCSSLRILPRAYLTIKQAIFKDLEKRGRMKSQSFRSAAVEANKLGRIYEFVTKVYPI